MHVEGAGGDRMRNCFVRMKKIPTVLWTDKPREVAEDDTWASRPNPMASVDFWFNEQRLPELRTGGTWVNFETLEPLKPWNWNRFAQELEAVRSAAAAAVGELAEDVMAYLFGL